MIVLLLYSRFNVSIMNSLLQNIKIQVHEKLYLKDPESSELGKKIIRDSILLIDEIGFDDFTFKKLGSRIGSTESSVYRYFENKHKLLLYLTSWYWGWMEYQLVFETHNLGTPAKSLKRAISILCRPVLKDSIYDHIDEEILCRIVINEYSKSYLTKEVDDENKEGYFAIYKSVIHRLRDMIQAVSPHYRHAASLASTVIEAALHQQFLKDHFKSITNCNRKEGPKLFLTDMVFKTISS